MPHEPEQGPLPCAVRQSLSVPGGSGSPVFLTCYAEPADRGQVGIQISEAGPAYLEVEGAAGIAQRLSELGSAENSRSGTGLSYSPAANDSVGDRPRSPCGGLWSPPSLLCSKRSSSAAGGAAGHSPSILSTTPVLGGLCVGHWSRHSGSNTSCPSSPAAGEFPNVGSSQHVRSSGYRQATPSSGPPRGRTALPHLQRGRRPFSCRGIGAPQSSGVGSGACVQIEAGKSQRGFPHPPASSDRHPEEESQGVPSQRAKIRERQHGPSTAAASRPSHQVFSHRRRSSAAAKAVQPALSVPQVMSLRFYLEVFSGSGRLSRALAKRTGQLCMLWDICLGEEYDLSNLSNVRLINSWIRAGVIIGVHLGTECKSFSRARDRPNGPPRLRSNQHVLGLPNIASAIDRRKVLIGNILMRASVRIFQTCLECLVPVTLENPASSRLWLCPGVLKLARHRRCNMTTVEFCMFGTPWRKSTSILGGFLELSSLSKFRCHGAKRGICARMGCRHLELSGKAPCGTFWTKIAEPYPKQFGKQLAQCFFDFEIQTIANNFSKRIM